MLSTLEVKELVNKFKPMMYCYLGSGMLTNDYDECVALANAKDAALLCVDQIVLNESRIGGIQNSVKANRKEGWDKAKEEIKSLQSF